MTDFASLADQHGGAWGAGADGGGAGPRELGRALAEDGPHLIDAVVPPILCGALTGQSSRAGPTGPMLHLRMFVPAELTETVLAVLADDPAVSSRALVRGASIQPDGDLVLADVAREAANDVIDRLRATGLHREGTWPSPRCPPGCRNAASTPNGWRRAAARTRSCGRR